MMERESYLKSVFIGTIGLIFALTLLSPINAFAQTEDQPDILPDNIFYGVKLAIENIQETLTFQEEKRAELLLKHAQERDREAKVLEKQMKSIPLDRLKEIQAEKIFQAEKIILKIEREHNISVQQEQNLELRQEMAEAGSDEDRALIQRQQQILDRESNLIEPSLEPRLIEGDVTIAEALQKDVPVKIVPVNDIEDDDTENEIVQKLRDRLQNAFSTSQITEIRAKFIEVTNEKDFERKVILAEQLDQKVNNPIINISCFGRVNTLLIAQAPDPVTELQEQCPILKTVNAETLRDMASDLN